MYKLPENKKIPPKLLIGNRNDYILKNLRKSSIKQKQMSNSDSITYTDLQ